MNPYLTDHDMIERILAAARRGVGVRLVVSGTRTTRSESGPRASYDGLIGAGVNI